MGSSGEFADYSGEQIEEHDLLKQQSSSAASVRAAPFSAVIGLTFIAVALVALIDALWVRIDVVLIVASMVAASGVAMFVGVSVRHRRRRRNRL